jgi:hypothetical protein
MVLNRIEIMSVLLQHETRGSRGGEDVDAGFLGRRVVTHVELWVDNWNMTAIILRAVKMGVP